MIVGSDGRLRLVDFELAAELGSGGSGESVGTVGYASREQYRGGFEAAGLDVVHDEEGLIGRGLYVAVAP